MKILQTLDRHRIALTLMSKLTTGRNFPDKYIVVAIDDPKSMNRQASWASDFDGADTHKIFKALSEQTRDS